MQSYSSSTALGPKPLGRYLVEAALVTPAQVEVALADQAAVGVRFGEVLALRGWIKQQTVEYLMQKLVLPERETAKSKLGSRERPERLEEPGRRPSLAKQQAFFGTRF